MLTVILKSIHIRSLEIRLGGTFGLHEDARKGRLLEKKKEVLLAFFKTFYESYKEEHGGTRPAFNFADLQEVASVKAILEDINVQTFPEMLLPELEAELRITLEGTGRKPQV